MRPVFGEGLVSFPAPGPWVDQGACKGVDPDLFFGDGRPTVESREARRLCEDCPVLADCRSYALRWPDIRGFWGGMTEGDRRDARATWRRRRVAS